VIFDHPYNDGYRAHMTALSLRFDRLAAMDCAVANTNDLARRQVGEDLSRAVAGGCGYVAAVLTDLFAFDP
jgi:hypothetical protein